MPGCGESEQHRRGSMRRPRQAGPSCHTPNQEQDMRDEHPTTSAEDLAHELIHAARAPNPG